MKQTWVLRSGHSIREDLIEETIVSTVCHTQVHRRKTWAYWDMSTWSLFLNSSSVSQRAERQPCMATHTCNLSMEEAETGGLWGPAWVRETNLRKHFRFDLVDIGFFWVLEKALSQAVDHTWNWNSTLRSIKQWWLPMQQACADKLNS